MSLPALAQQSAAHGNPPSPPVAAPPAEHYHNITHQTLEVMRFAAADPTVTHVLKVRGAGCGMAGPRNQSADSVPSTPSRPAPAALLASRQPRCAWQRLAMPCTAAGHHCRAGQSGFVGPPPCALRLARLARRAFRPVCCRQTTTATCTLTGCCTAWPARTGEGDTLRATAAAPHVHATVRASSLAVGASACACATAAGPGLPALRRLQLSPVRGCHPGDATGCRPADRPAVPHAVLRPPGSDCSWGTLRTREGGRTATPATPGESVAARCTVRRCCQPASCSACSSGQVLGGGQGLLPLRPAPGSKPRRPCAAIAVARVLNLSTSPLQTVLCCPCSQVCEPAGVARGAVPAVGARRRLCAEC